MLSTIFTFKFYIDIVINFQLQISNLNLKIIIYVKKYRLIIKQNKSRNIL